MTTKEELFCRGCSHRAGFALPGLWALSLPFGCYLTLFDLGPASLAYVHLFHTPSSAGAPLYTVFEGAHLGGEAESCQRGSVIQRWEVGTFWVRTLERRELVEC